MKKCRSIFFVVVTLVLVGFALMATPARARQKKALHLIHSLKVIVRTGDDFGASTQAAVWFSLGPSYRWTLDTPGHPPFQNAAYDVFHLSPNGLCVEDIKWIRLRKSEGDDWLLHGLEVWINGRPYYLNDHIDTWLSGTRLVWSAPVLPKGW